jgi:transposase-like protein
MDLERPEWLEPERCPICDEPMAFNGTQQAGLAQFFCEDCKHRSDRYVGATDAAVNAD